MAAAPATPEPESPAITVGPAIVSSPASGDTYGKDEAIVVAVTFSEAVSVTGDVRVHLSVGERQRRARYARSEQDGTVQVFAYTVKKVDADSDGVSIEANQVLLRGGSVADGDGNAADLNHAALPAQSGHKVNGAQEAAPAQGQQEQAANGPPQFAGDTATRSVSEDAAVGANVGNAIAATDADDDALTYALSGSDAFAIGASTGQITLKSSLDYETQSSYALTVSVSDGKNDDDEADSAVDDTIAVTVSVGNVDEAGVVSLEWVPDRPEVGSELRATLLDPDGGVSGLAWSWQRSTDGSAWDDVAGASGASYTLTGEDGAHYLRATAAYADDHGTGKTAVSAAVGPVAATVTRQEPETQAQTTTEVWSATLTVQDTGGILGCDNNETDYQCSNASILTDDDFTYKGATQTIATFLWHPVDGFEVLYLTLVGRTTVQAKAALTGLTLHVDGREFAVADSTASTNGITWSIDLDWSAGDTVALSLTAPRAPAPTGFAAHPASADGVGLVWDDPDDDTITWYQYRLKPKSGSESGYSDWANIAGTGKGSVFGVITGLPAREHTFQVRAVDAHGPGLASSEAKVTPRAMVTCQAATATGQNCDVAQDWHLVPDGISEGDSFRLALITSGITAATSTDIATYNTTAQNSANDNPFLNPISGSFRALVSTSAVDARPNTHTRSSDLGNGDPIYWADGPKIADDYADLYDGGWDYTGQTGQYPRNSKGVTITAAWEVWTGSKLDGTGLDSSEMGANNVIFGKPNTAGREMGANSATGNTKAKATTLSVYAISPVLTVPEAPEVDSVEITSTPEEGGDDNDTYDFGDVIEVTFTFSAAITVAGTPTLKIMVGSEEKTADCAHKGTTGDDAKKLVCRYTVAAGDADADGISVAADQLEGTIKNSTNSDASLTYTALPNDPEHKVDGARDFIDDVASVTCEAATDTGTRCWVPHDWELIPTVSGQRLAPGQSFRLMFATSTGRNAADRTVGPYNTLVQSAADTNPLLQPMKSHFRAMVQPWAAADHMRPNTKTRATDLGADSPIYWLNGVKVADNYADLYDGSWDYTSIDGEWPSNESGADITRPRRVWTGSKPDGTNLANYQVGQRQRRVRTAEYLGPRAGRSQRNHLGRESERGRQHRPIPAVRHVPRAGRGPAAVNGRGSGRGAGAADRRAGLGPDPPGLLRRPALRPRRQIPAPVRHREPAWSRVLRRHNVQPERAGAGEPELRPAALQGRVPRRHLHRGDQRPGQHRHHRRGRFHLLAGRRQGSRRLRRLLRRQLGFRQSHERGWGSHHIEPRCLDRLEVRWNAGFFRRDGLRGRLG